MVERVAILGCGTIGSAWATYFLAKGLDVAAWDPAADFEARLRPFIEAGTAALRELDSVAVRPGALTIAADPSDAVRGSQWVQESAVDDLRVKRELYQRIAPALDAEAIVASSTSFLMPSDLQQGLPFAERLVVGHPFNPPHLIPLVEVVGGRLTAAASIDRAQAFYARIGKRAIRLKKEAPGHLVNRLQTALWREAVHAVVDGIADLADVDTAIAYGPGLRWALMGPHLTFHLAGGDGGMRYFLDHLGAANEAAWRDLGQPSLDAATSAALIDGCAAQTRGYSTEQLRARRDAQLLALLKHVERVL